MLLLPLTDNRNHYNKITTTTKAFSLTVISWIYNSVAD